MWSKNKPCEAPLFFLALNAMGRLLRKELLRVTIIQKVNKIRKKHPDES